MTRSDLLRDLSRKSASAVRLVACVALAATMTGCGPLGDDDEEEPSPTRAASPVAAASPPASPRALATPSARSSPTERVAGDVGDGTPLARPTRAPTDGAAEDETPAADATEEPDDETPTPPVVEDCEEPEDLPPVQGAVMRVISAEADEGVNLRTGPGESCDLLTTLDPATEVEVVSGPVSAGEFLWVKVDVAGDEGWLAEEFLDPVTE